MAKLTPFKVAIPDAKIADILDRVRRYDWSAVHDAGGWSSGMAIRPLRTIVDYWLERYDWRAAEAGLNRYPQFIADVDGQRLHFVLERGSGTDAGSDNPPLLLLHGWPGSYFEFLHVIERFAHPERFGGSAADGVDVIAPSLPGYGFSGAPAKPIGPHTAATMFQKLVTQVLGYPRYVVQGGDWGNLIATWMAFKYPESVAGLHLNMVSLLPPDVKPATPEEIAHANLRADLYVREGPYSLLQGTKPQNLALAVAGNPVGLAAWIWEKFAAWSDLPRDETGGPDLLAGHSADGLITNLMIYLVTDSFATSLWMYQGRHEDKPSNLPEAARMIPPTAIAAFPDPTFVPPPRTLVARAYNVVRWTKMARGGHFAALEAPDLFVADVADFLRSLR